MKSRYACLPALFVGSLFLQNCNKDKKDTPAEPSPLVLRLNKAKPTFKDGGMVAAIRSKDGTFQYGAFGNSHPDVPLTPEMSLGIGSVTKTYTATLIFKLIEAKKIQLTLTLNDLLPEKVSTKVPGNITVAQLLNHSSGLYDPIDDLIGTVLAKPSKAIDLETDYFAQHMQNPVFSPGTRHEYSNTNYLLLGFIIEKASGMKYHEYLRKTILDPLKLSGTFFLKDETPKLMGYSWYEGKSLKDVDRTAIESLGWAAGSISATVKDVADFYYALFNGKIIGEASLKSMKTFQSIDLKELGSTVEVGSGIFRYIQDGKTTYLHTGSTVAYGSHAIYIEQTGEVLVVITNTAEKTDDVVRDVLSERLK